MPYVFVGGLALPIRHQAQLQTRLEGFPVAKTIPAFHAGLASLRRQGGRARSASSPADTGQPHHRLSKELDHADSLRVRNDAREFR
jgi:hypothetical protein